MALFPRERLTSKMNHLLTQGLFIEYKHQTGNINSPYTLKEFEVHSCTSMYREFMKFNTEYEAAIHILGSWTHWKRLCDCEWFQGYIGYWREEMSIRNEAMSKAVLLKNAEEGNTVAAKAVIEQETKKTKGRPSKAEVKGERNRQASVDTKVTSILERMNGK